MGNQKTRKIKSYVIPDNDTSSKVEEPMFRYQVDYTNPIALLTGSKEGLSPATALDFLSFSGFTYDEFQETYKTTVKTIQNYANHGQKLDASLSERLLKSFVLFRRGVDVFGSVKAFHQWLNTPAYGLGNQTPFSLMDTFTGLSLIDDELVRIAYGDLA